MIRFLLLILFFIFLPQGLSQCTVKNMTITQRKVGDKYVRNKPVWKVKISNNCYCSQLDVKIGCKGFETVKPVHPSRVKIISWRKGLAVVNGGQPIYPYSSFSFTYAWSLPFPCRIVSSQVACS